jgi:Asp/Glu/hydantoin racemase
MPAILAINPNTTVSITTLIETNLRAAAPEVEWRMATGRFGARYIVSEASYAIAAHAALEAWANHSTACDAVLLACFGDPGLFALREQSPIPVLGLAEASMRAAVREAARFSIVTGGARWTPMLERLAHALGFGAALASVRTITLTGAQAAADPDAAIAVLAGVCTKAKRDDGAGAVILGGAGFAGLAARVAPLAGFSIIDSVIAGAQEAARLARGAVWPYARPAASQAAESLALDRELAAKLKD